MGFEKPHFDIPEESKGPLRKAMREEGPKDPEKDRTWASPKIEGAPKPAPTPEEARERGALGLTPSHINKEILQAFRDADMSEKQTLVRGLLTTERLSGKGKAELTEGNREALEWLRTTKDGKLFFDVEDLEKRGEN